MLAIVSFVLPMGEAVIFKRSTPSLSYLLTEVVLMAYAIYWWYVLDRREREFPAGAFQNMAVAVFALVGLPVYFIRSRGLLQGSAAIGVAIFIFICVSVLAYAGGQAGRAIAF
jgi:hypothetical protein